MKDAQCQLKSQSSRTAVVSETCDEISTAIDIQMLLKIVGTYKLLIKAVYCFGCHDETLVTRPRLF